MNPEKSQTQSVSLTVAQQAQEIDRISSAAMEAFNSAESFEKELAVAQGIIDMRAALTPEIMKPVMGLMNTSLGFRTDRDPNQIDKNTSKPFVPYDEPTVKECFIESRLRGFHTCGNEWNIIAGRFYGCVGGFERKVRTHPRVTDFRETFDVPRIVGDKGALVKCRADWKQDGVPQSLERDFAVRVNAGMGADAIVGKAKRKLFAAVHARLTGQVTPEGEVGDEPIVNVQATTTTVDASEVFKGKQAKAATVAESKGELVQEQLAKMLDEAGFNFKHLQAWNKETGFIKDLHLYPSFAGLPDPVACKLINARAGLLAGLAKYK